MRRRLLAAFAALVLLAAGSLVLLGYVRGADARALAGARPVQVLVVDQPVPAGTSGDELAEFVTTETVPAKAALDGRVTDLADLSGRVATVDLLVGDATKARTVLGWKPTVAFPDLVAMMVDNDLAQQKLVAGL